MEYNFGFENGHDLGKPIQTRNCRDFEYIIIYST